MSDVKRPPLPVLDLKFDPHPRVRVVLDLTPEGYRRNDLNVFHARVLADIQLFKDTAKGPK